MALLDRRAAWRSWARIKSGRAPAQDEGNACVQRPAIFRRRGFWSIIPNSPQLRRFSNPNWSDPQAIAVDAGQAGSQPGDKKSEGRPPPEFKKAKIEGRGGVMSDVLTSAYRRGRQKTHDSAARFLEKGWRSRGYQVAFCQPRRCRCLMVGHRAVCQVAAAVFDARRPGQVIDQGADGTPPNAVLRIQAVFSEKKRAGCSP